MSNPTPGQPVGGNPVPPPGTPSEPYAAPTQAGYTPQQGYPAQPGYPVQPGYPPQPESAPQPGAPFDPAAYGAFPPPPPKTGLAKVPLPAWIAGGVVVILAVVLTIVFTTGGSGNSGNACKDLESRVLPIAQKLESDSSSANINALKGDVDQLAGVLDQTAGEASGKTASDMRAMASDLHAMSQDISNLDLNSIQSLADKVDTDGSAIDADCPGLSSLDEIGS